MSKIFKDKNNFKAKSEKLSKYIIIFFDNQAKLECGLQLTATAAEHIKFNHDYSRRKKSK